MPKNAPYNSFEDTDPYLNKKVYGVAKSLKLKKSQGGRQAYRESGKKTFSKIGKYLPRWLWDADDSDKIKVKGK